MSAKSKAYISAKSGDNTYKYYFTGVLSIEHNYTLNLDNTSSQGTDITNGARNQPNRVSLSVLETDAAHSSGWSSRMLEALNAIKKKRLLCKVVTSMGTYSNMLLSEITATQDDENQIGWKGTLVFVEYIPQSSNAPAKKKTNNNSSSRTNNGSSNGGTQIPNTPFLQMLQRAGIS